MKKEETLGTVVALSGIAAVGYLTYATRRLWLPKAKEYARKLGYFKEPVYEAPALNPRYDINEEAQIDAEVMTALDQKVREFFKAVVQKTKGECLMDPVIVCESKFDQPRVEIPETEDTENFIDIIIAEGERIFKHEAQYLGTKIVF